MQHLLMAATVMASLPPVILFFAAQRYFVRGIVLSGLKG
jgi:multiple sugar transport system permease protein